MSRFAALGLIVLAGLAAAARADEPDRLDAVLPVRGLCIASPSPKRVDEFARFIELELAPRHVNTLILRVDFNYQYASRPELASADGLSKADAAKLVEVCKKRKIRIIPQVNLLGHQSWSGHVGKLLQVYPEFDETPWVKMPEKYKWPNPDGLYCKSYCPLHPRVHEVVFPVVDEICEAFEADAFHAGLDEVFYIGEAKCERCGGKDRSVLLADEVKRIRDHLAAKNRRLWIWADRLIDGRTTGLGEWEASTNDTHRAVDLIPKDVVLCDWHYVRPDPTTVAFALKGLDVVACPWRKPSVALMQLEDMTKLRERSSRATRKHLLGMVQTVWSGADGFIDEYYGRRPPRRDAKPDESEVACFHALFDAVGKLEAKGESAAATEEGR
ncbi:family 20 glycosylhydrolase [Paludisphaera mucosa]|uniref:Family 20 glycosylhydrolase n=1 Tax=Paludisphaera mucosa TaxID=3030827 RepID=A0ABT6F9J1_9BACT|nr:family 20 glycosylhydrolase [Paludisphaera mucosa]MDG3004063.1 family 20 glycosylhydrolase [Paludisphaera mucosa]